MSRETFTTHKIRIVGYGVTAVLGSLGLMSEFGAMATDDMNVPGPIESNLFGWIGFGLICLGIVTGILTLVFQQIKDW